MHPLLEAIDALLADHDASVVLAVAEGGVLHEVAGAVGHDPASRLPIIYRDVTIARSLAQIDGGWAVRTRAH